MALYSYIYYIAIYYIVLYLEFQVIRRGIRIRSVICRWRNGRPTPSTAFLIILPPPGSRSYMDCLLINSFFGNSANKSKRESCLRIQRSKRESFSRIQQIKVKQNRVWEFSEVKENRVYVDKLVLSVIGRRVISRPGINMKWSARGEFGDSSRCNLKIRFAV